MVGSLIFLCAEFGPPASVMGADRGQRGPRLGSRSNRAVRATSSAGPVITGMDDLTPRGQRAPSEVPSVPRDRRRRRARVLAQDGAAVTRRVPNGSGCYQQTSIHHAHGRGPQDGPAPLCRYLRLYADTYVLDIAPGLGPACLRPGASRVRTSNQNGAPSVAAKTVVRRPISL